MKILRNSFCAWWRMFNFFVSTCAVAFCMTYGKNNTCKCDNEGFVPVSSLCGVFGSPSLFIIFLIGRTGKMWYVVYVNVKWTYTSGTLACTIRECETVRNVLHEFYTSFRGWDTDVKHASPNAKRVSRHLRWYSTASKMISCICIQY